MIVWRKVGRARRVLYKKTLEDKQTLSSWCKSERREVTRGTESRVRRGGLGGTNKLVRNVITPTGATRIASKKTPREEETEKEEMKMEVQKEKTYGQRNSGVEETCTNRCK